LPLIVETSLHGNTYNQDKGNLKPMKFVQFIILVFVLGWCLSPVHFTGNVVYAKATQAEKDSIVAPNVFTPNGDGENDFFIVRSSNDEPVTLKIYTRAGVLVFSIEARLCVWNGCSLGGKPMTDGVYYYTAEVRGSSPKVSKSGFLYLYR